jgi:hypothetical protein
VNHLIGWVRAYCARKVVRKHKSWVCFENATTSRRRCCSSANSWGDVDYTFMRSGDVVLGPFGREVVQ